MHLPFKILITRDFDQMSWAAAESLAHRAEAEAKGCERFDLRDKP
jgi:hypothetical protein